MPQDAYDLELKIWQQERDFWLPRILIVLTTNSILFVGFVQIMDSGLGMFLGLLAFVSNFAILYLYHQYEKKLNRFEDKIKHRLPRDYCKRSSKKISLGRYGYIPVISIYIVMWGVSIWYSYSYCDLARQQSLDFWQWIITLILSIINRISNVLPC